jgi:SAM-dependent MidA family methyltransferase
LLKYFPYEDFIIYETGAGNGTLAQNILDFLASEHPEVYERTQYRIIEISSALASLQRKRLASKHPCVEIINESIFEWKRPEYAPCFVLALEVIVSFFELDEVF